MKTKKPIAYESPLAKAADSFIPENLVCAASLSGNNIEDFTTEDEFDW